ncbi:hypothetical protein FSP39_000594 [Pinctada imbricata]|uniref:Uncharacterized protein n=1 Tax=Pinctada imbricata TaxID=66713 RepID=A0AA88XP48_PINIB|nr:hypothetical protein FSP39_000594 [Pinctada imbricata]
MDINSGCVFVLIILCFDTSYCEQNAKRYYAYKIQTEIIENYSYKPSINPDLKSDIDVSFTLCTLNDFDEIRGNLETVGILYVLWNDARLVWNATYYGGIEYIPCHLRDVWKPDVALLNSMEKFELINRNIEKTTVWVTNTGHVHYALGSVFKTSCDPNPSHFPFDTHECYIIIVLLNEIFFTRQNESDNNIRLHAPLINASDIQDEDGKWEYRSLPACIRPIENTSVYGAIFPVRLTRRSLFVVVNIVIPIILLGHLNVCVFLIPVQAGERISLAITMLLSYTVFLTLVSSSIPETSNPMPLICLFLIFKLSFSAGIVVCVVLVTRFAHRDDDIPMSKFARVFTLRMENFNENVCLGNIYNTARKRTDSVLGSTHSKNISKRSRDEKDENDQIETSVSWIRMSRAFDRAFFWFFLIVITIETVAFFVILMRNVGVDESNDVADICQ